ncbi:hypothetical protein CsSME_00027791 [Camellia sinensis var. sinensis]
MPKSRSTPNLPLAGSYPRGLPFYMYKLAEERADDDDAKAVISQLRKSVLEELKMHDSFVQLNTRTNFEKLELEILYLTI